MQTVKTPRPFKPGEWFRPGPPGTRYPKQMAPWIDGVYGIRNARTKAMLYVGESHTGRLYETIKRHMGHWIDRGEPREAYHRDDVEIAWYATDKPLDHEAYLIKHYQPRDNTKGLEEEPTQEEAAPDWSDDGAQAPWFEPVTTEDGVPF